VKDQLEALVGQMVERGILFEEAVNEFEKKIHQARAGSLEWKSIPRCAFVGHPS